MSHASSDPGRRDEPPGEDELWEAVADPSRRKVLDLILAHGQATPTTLAAELPFTRQAVAKHLAILTRAGRVEAAARALASAAEAMAAAAARWDQRLNAIKRLAEAQARSGQTEPPAMG